MVDGKSSEIYKVVRPNRKKLRKIQQLSAIQQVSNLHDMQWRSYH